MPSITTWNRIEPRSRSTDLMEGLAARVQDPLWMLTRQWQIGEFEARNTGSPVTTTVKSRESTFDRLSIAGRAQAYDGGKPIEVHIEQEAVRPVAATTDLRQAAEAGLYFARLIKDSAIVALCLAHFPLAASSGDAHTISSIVAGRVIDGIKLHQAIGAAAGKLPPLPGLTEAQQAASAAAVGEWLKWYGSLFSEPESGARTGWDVDHMEYSFALGVAGGTDSFVAKEYDGGSVEWHTFDRSATPIAGGTAAKETTQTVTATPVSFPGMPARRFWEMEDASTDISQLSAAAEDLGRILLREFALIYGSDWFQFPLTFPVGSEVEILSLTIVDTFGIPTAIPHYSVVDGAAAKWRMFACSPDAPPTGRPAATQPILLTPSAVAPNDGAPVEEVLLLRDELANMVWGIERTVVGASGQPFDRTTAWNISRPVVPPPAANAAPEYRLGSSVPDYWIPFIPGLVSPRPANGSNSVSLRRGRMPTPQSGALGQMLKDMDSGFRLEEVPREGVLLERRYRSARSTDGSAYLWMARERSVGKGTGQSGIHFDFLE